MPRDAHNFPSRQYSYRDPRRAGLVPPLAAFVPGATYRFVLGRDSVPVLIDDVAEAERPHDPFARLVLFSGSPRPMTARTLLAQLDALNLQPFGLPGQRCFVVADGGQIPWSPETDDLRREFRFLIARQRTAADQPDLLISTGTALDSESMFLQVIGWDEAAGAFQFYERREGAWVWAGSSWNALEDDARGQGPFDSHVNGALNMKELKQPWVHWHSMAAQIPNDALHPSDPLRSEPLWAAKTGAEDFETQVARPGIRRWITERVRRSTAGGTLTHLPTFMRQVLDTTTVNLASSADSSASLTSVARVRLPLTFFIASDSLFDVVGLAPNVQVPTVASDVYRETIERFDVHRQERTHRFAGDTHFVFVVPEPAFEDVVVLELLVGNGVLSTRLAAAVLMVDFTNPVYSERRSALMRYVPAESSIGNPDALDTAFVDAVQRSAQASVADSPETEFLANWMLPEPGWQAAYESRIESFFAHLAPGLATVDGFSELFRIADSRRREFRLRKLAEFSLTVPFTNVPRDAPFLALTPDGRVVQKS